MREPSASKLALADRCGYPWTSGARWPAYTQSTYAVFGTRVHLACEALTTGDACYPAAYHGLDAANVERLDGCVAAAREYLLTRARGERFAEVDLRYNVETGEARVSTETWKRPGEWTGHVDLAILHDGVLDVIDWKTGYQEHSKPEDHWQVRFYALATARAFGARSVRAALVYLDPGRYWEDACSFDALDLATIAHDCKDLRKRLTKGPTPPTPGPWCTQQYCPLVGDCPATRAALASAYQLEQALSVTIRDDEHARYTLERLAGARAVLESIDKAVKDYARTRPIPLGDGRVYGWRKHTRRTLNLDTRERIAALRSVLGIAADKAIKVEASTTLEGIKAAARELAGGPGKRGQRAIEKEALAALEAVGGVTESEYEKPEAFEPATEDTTE